MKKFLTFDLTLSAVPGVEAGVLNLGKLRQAGGATSVLGAAEPLGERVICRLVSPSLATLKI